MAGSKSIQNRVDDVLALLQKGQRRSDIIAKIQEEKNNNGWSSTSNRVIDKAIAMAVDKLLDRLKVDPNTELAMSIGQYEELYRLAVDKGDINAARGVRRDLDKVIQLQTKLAMMLQKEARQDLITWADVVEVLEQLAAKVCEECRPLLASMIDKAKEQGNLT